MKIQNNFKMAACVPFQDVFEEVTRSDTEELQDSSEEESDRGNESIETATCGEISHFLNKRQKRCSRFLKTVSRN